ncbi:DNA adenine methylase [bacterium]|nr:DNA adenine methylase [bacterium]
MKIPTNNLFKWIGGKKWLSKQLLEKTKQTIQKDKNIYIEPFLGGMGSFLAILPELLNKNINKFILNDINPVIIHLLNEIKENPNNIIKNYKKIQEDFYKTFPKEVYSLHPTTNKDEIKILLKKSNDFFKEKKKRFNLLKLKENNNTKEKEELNYLFLFLMKNSFNGIYRENLKGEFNTPFNWNNKKEKLDKEITILEYHRLFNTIDVVFENLDVFELLNKYNNYKTSFLYLDPPYANEDEKENKYNKEHFNFDKQKELLNYLNNYENYIYSNHSIEFFQKYFQKDQQHSFIEVERKNIMTSKKENRSNNVKEILGIKK